MPIQQDLLDHITDLLNEGGASYTVFLYAQTLSAPSRSAPYEVLRQALGERIEIGGIKPVTADEARAVVQTCLRYSPDDGNGPLLAAEPSGQFAVLAAQLDGELAVVLDEARKIEQFWLSEGHPAHPVLWDFALLITGYREALLLMGSAAD